MKRLKLVLFDMDGVLTDFQNSWTVLHEYFGTNNEKSLHQFLRGEIDDREFIRRDIALWLKKRNRIHISEIEKAVSHVTASEDARVFMRFLSANNIKGAIITGGVDIFANRIGKELGIHIVRANGFILDDEGYLTGEGVVNVPLRHKDIVARKIREEMNVTKAECVAIGDSFIDVPMFKEARFGIAVRAQDDTVRDAARYSISNLVDAIPILCETFS